MLADRLKCATVNPKICVAQANLRSSRSRRRMNDLNERSVGVR